MTFKTGKEVAQYIDGGDVDEDQIQPNGVDLTIGKLEIIAGVPEITEGDYYKGERVHIIKKKSGMYELEEEPYIVTYDEKIEIPDDCVGYVFPRSRLPRCGLYLTTALWDAGYEGKGEGLLMPKTEMSLQNDMRVAQICFIEADKAAELYDGTHQNENL